MPTQLAVAAGGALGALTRYLVDRSLEARASGVFPWSTFTINLSGCFIVGVVVAALVDRHNAPQSVRSESEPCSPALASAESSNREAPRCRCEAARRQVRRGSRRRSS